MNKNDTRYIAADKKIREAFCRILHENPIDKASTGEIITAAGVHKSTFYSHYRDKYDLLDSIENELVDVLYPSLEGIFIDMLKERCSHQELLNHYDGLAHVIFNHEDLFRLILRDQSGSITLKIAEKIEHIWQDQGIADPALMFNTYLINGVTYVMIGTIEKWIRRGCVDPIDDFITIIDTVGISVQNAAKVFDA